MEVTDREDIEIGIAGEAPEREVRKRDPDAMVWVLLRVAQHVLIRAVPRAEHCVAVATDPDLLGCASQSASVLRLAPGRRSARRG